jgi:peptidoglycan/LPS O-acetylase OafA/YrhL
MTSTTRGSAYRPELDGIRAFAVLVVMLFHGSALWSRIQVRGGFLGVDVFFVLSGFLITSLLLGEWNAKDRIDRRKFYARRVLRLLPALVLTIALGGVVTALVARPYPRPYVQSALMTLSYVANWFQASKTLAPLGHTWSLSIEEQYYLVWPTLLILALRRKNVRRERLAAVVLAGAIAMSVIRYLFFATKHIGLAEASTFSRPDGILIGTALAIALAGQTPRLRSLLARRDLAWAAGAFVVVGAVVIRQNDRALYYGLWTLFNVCTAIVIGHLTVAPRTSMRTILSIQPLPAIGRISYGLYLFHVPLYNLLLGNPPSRHGVEVYVLFFALSFIAAIGSFVVVESQFLKWKTRFEPRRQAGTLEGRVASTDDVHSPSDVED